MDPIAIATIYALLEPDTKMPVYVGMTTRTPDQRLKEHISGRWTRSCDRSPIHLWLRELVDERKQRPLIVELGQYPLEVAGYAELAWYRFYLEHGARLLNANPPEVVVMRSVIESVRRRRPRRLKVFVHPDTDMDWG